MNCKHYRWDSSDGFNIHGIIVAHNRQIVAKDEGIRTKPNQTDPKKKNRKQK